MNQKKYKKNNNLIVGILSTGILVLLVFSLQLTAKQSITNTRSEAHSAKIATDPKFEEKEGSLLPGIPLFPTYPGSTLVGSSWIDTDTTNHKGFRIMWNSSDSVPAIMRWYESKFRDLGWNVEMTNDPTSEGEQVSNISKQPYKGYIAAEIEDGTTEIVIDMRKQ